MRTLFVILLMLASNPAAARDVKCDRWTDEHGRNMMKCDYVDAPDSPATPPPVQAQQQPSPPPYQQAQQQLPPPLMAPSSRPAWIFRFGPFIVIVR